MIVYCERMEFYPQTSCQFQHLQPHFTGGNLSSFPKLWASLHTDSLGYRWAVDGTRQGGTGQKLNKDPVEKAILWCAL